MRLAAVLTALALGMGVVAGCGDDDDDEDSGNGGGGQEAAQPATVKISTSGSGKDQNITVPESVPGGVVRLEFTNEGEEPSGAQIIRYDDGHTASDALRRGAAWGEGQRPLPPWVYAVGGVPTTAPGETETAVQELAPGNYVVADVATNAFAEFEVTEPQGETELPAPAGKIEATEYEFAASGLQSGANEVLIDNVGREPHFIEAVKIKEGNTIEDVRNYVRDEKGKAPIETGRPISTPVIDGGERQVLELELESGSYALLCFVPDRAGGPPHVAKGMVSEAQVP